MKDIPIGDEFIPDVKSMAFARDRLKGSAMERQRADTGCRYRRTAPDLLFWARGAYYYAMAMVRLTEQQAERFAHLLDDVFRVPGTRMRMGMDPLLGLIPVVGDAIATVSGAAVLVIARQLNVPWSLLGTMAYNVFKNGLFGSVPFVGDAYSFYFKSNAVNTALILRAVKHGKEGACSLTTRPLTIQDVVGLALLILPTIALVVFVSFWFWDHNISYLSIIFPRFYQRWGG